MRARLAVASAGFAVALREIVLRDKAADFIAASPKATVPVLVLPDGTVIEESLDIMLHVLGQHDPEHLLRPEHGTREDMLALIAECDGPFKTALDRYKYANHYEDSDPLSERDTASNFLRRLDDLLVPHAGFLYGGRPSLADFAILPFVRQFANVDRAWFDAGPWPHLLRALNHFTNSARFAAIMGKYRKWQPGDSPLWFAADPVPQAQICITNE
tara:strand:+ start:1184 stop:1828 length:645 start_codon:yes stop_codon:yes gene_type:complete